jgi:hypothetical protein
MEIERARGRTVLALSAGFAIGSAQGMGDLKTFYGAPRASLPLRASIVRFPFSFVNVASYAPRHAFSLVSAATFSNPVVRVFARSRA